MAFTSTSWSNGDIVTETKLDQMVGNDEHVRDEAEFRYIANESALAIDDTAIAGTLTVQLSIDGADFGSGDSGSGVLGEDNISVSSLSAGDHYAELTMTGSSINGPLVLKYYFVKTTDLLYITWRATTHQGYVASSSGSIQNYGLKDIAIIGHRSTRTWTN